MLFYDRNNTCSFALGYRDGNGNLGRITIDGIQPFGTEIKTEQYKLGGATLTGNSGSRACR